MIYINRSNKYFRDHYIPIVVPRNLGGREGGSVCSGGERERGTSIMTCDRLVPRCDGTGT